MNSRLRCCLVCLVLWQSAGPSPGGRPGAWFGPGPSHAQAQPDGQDLLLQGVRAFRQDRYDEALRLFQRVESSREIGLYLGMTLHKLGRHAEALGAFRAAHGAGLSEPVADYYQAVSCFRLGLYQRAWAGFLSLQQREAAPGGGQVGPRLQLGAARFLGALEALLPGRADSGAGGPGAAPERRRSEAAEAALGHAEQALSGPGGEAEALEWADEAAQIARTMQDRGQVLPKLRRLIDRLSGRRAADARGLLCAVEGRPGC